MSALSDLDMLLLQAQQWHKPNAYTLRTFARELATVRAEIVDELRATRQRAEAAEDDAYVYRVLLLIAALAAVHEWYTSRGQVMPPPSVQAQDADQWFTELAGNARRVGAMADADVDAMIRVQAALAAMVAPREQGEVQP